MDNVNPLWESHQKPDAEVVEYYEPLIKEVTPDDIGKKSLNTKITAYHYKDNFEIRKEDNLDEGMSLEDAEKDAQEYADTLYANTLLALDDLYKAREA